MVSNYGFTKMQRRVAIWILGAFHTLPFFGIEAITGLIPIHLYLCKLSGRAQLKAHLLSHNYILQPLLKSKLSLCNDPHYLLLDSLSPHQWEMIKGPVIDIDNRFNEVFPAFDLLHKEFSPGSHIIDIFPSCFSFHPFNKLSINNLIFQSSPLQIPPILLLLLMLISKTMSPSPLLIFMSITNPSSKPHIMP